MKVGFARVEMTPPLGSYLRGYFRVREADGIITPLYVNAVSFDDGEKKATLVTLDLCGVSKANCDVIRKYAAEKNGVDVDSIFISCTHTHLGPDLGDLTKSEPPAYGTVVMRKISDAITLAIADLAEAKAFTARGKAEGISFVRVYRMNDGSIKTNPGKNPDVTGPVGTPDEEVRLIRFKRENAPDVAVVNFQTHPDVIGSVKEYSCKICYDWPGFVRDILEQSLTEVADGRGVHVICVNGAEGDVNHVNRLDRHNGVVQSKHMARVISGEVLGMYTYAEEIDCETLKFGKKAVRAKVAKGTPEQIEMARQVKKVYDEGGAKAVMDAGLPFPISVASRYLRLVNSPDEADIFVSALTLGEIAFVGFPGEPFTEVGRQTKANSPFGMTVPCCLTNATDGYFPTKNIFEGGGYEAGASRFEVGTAEKLIDAAIELTKELKEDQ